MYVHVHCVSHLPELIHVYMYSTCIVHIKKANCVHIFITVCIFIALSIYMYMYMYMYIHVLAVTMYFTPSPAAVAENMPLHVHVHIVTMFENWVCQTAHRSDMSVMNHNSLGCKQSFAHRPTVHVHVVYTVHVKTESQDTFWPMPGLMIVSYTGVTWGTCTGQFFLEKAVLGVYICLALIYHVCHLVWI